MAIFEKELLLTFRVTATRGTRSEASGLAFTEGHNDNDNGYQQQRR